MSATSRSWNSSKQTTVSSPSAAVEDAREVEQLGEHVARLVGAHAARRAARVATRVTPRRADGDAEALQQPREGLAADRPAGPRKPRATRPQRVADRRHGREVARATARWPASAMRSTCASSRLVLPNRRGAASRNATRSAAARWSASSSCARSISRLRRDRALVAERIGHGPIVRLRRSATYARGVLSLSAHHEALRHRLALDLARALALEVDPRVTRCLEPRLKVTRMRVLYGARRSTRRRLPRSMKNTTRRTRGFRRPLRALIRTRTGTRPPWGMQPKPARSCSLGEPPGVLGTEAGGGCGL